MSAPSLTEGRLPRQILLFSLPLILSNLLQVLFNLADVAVVGRFVGSEALGSVGSTTILITLFTDFIIGFSFGFNVHVARFLGAGKDREVRDTVHTAAVLSALAGLILTLSGLVFTRALLELLRTKNVLLDGAVLYLRLYLLGTPALALYQFGQSVLSAAGDTRRPLYILTAAGVVNVALNLLFVIVCGMGVAGVAIASAASQWLSAVWVLALLLRSNAVYALRPALLRLYPGKVRLILSTSLFAGFQNAVFAIANLFIQSAVNSFDAIVVEGNSAAVNSDALVYGTMSAFYTACSSFLSQNYGAGKRKRVLQSYLLSMAYSFVFAAVLGGGLALFGRHFLRLFTTEEAVIEAGMYRLTIMGLSYAFSAFMDCTSAASRGLGYSVVPMVLVILGSCVFRVFWICTVFAHFHTLTSLYSLYICSFLLTGAAEIAYFAFAYRKSMAQLED